MFGKPVFDINSILNNKLLNKDIIAQLVNSKIATFPHGRENLSPAETPTPTTSMSISRQPASQPVVAPKSDIDPKTKSILDTIKAISMQKQPTPEENLSAGFDEAGKSKDLLGALGTGAASVLKYMASPVGRKLLSSTMNPYAGSILAQNAEKEESEDRASQQANTALGQKALLDYIIGQSKLETQGEQGESLLKTKLGEEMQQLQYKLKSETLNARERNALLLQLGDLKNQLSEMRQSQKSENKNRQNEVSLRKEFNNLPEIKQYKTIVQFSNRLKGAGNTPAGDLTTIFSYMKMLDPESVVREGEQASAQNTAGVPDRVRNLYNKVVSGARLNYVQRKQFRDEADRILKDSSSIYNQRATEYKGYANDYGVNAENIVGKQEVVKESKPAINQTSNKIPRIKNDDDYDKLNPGTQFYDPKGVLRTKK